MAKKEKFAEQEQSLENFQSALTTTESFIEKNQKLLIGIFAGIIVLVVAWMLYDNFYRQPNEKEALELLSKGQTYFTNGDYNAVINGDTAVGYAGLKPLYENFSGTTSGKLAGAYLGIACYRTGDYDNALKYLEAYSADDNILQYTVLGTIGDCYVQKGDTKKGIEYFLKAAKSDNILVKPVYKVKAAKAYLSLGDYQNAIDLYTEVKNEATPEQRSMVQEVMEIDKYLEFAKYSMENNGK